MTNDKPAPNVKCIRRGPLPACPVHRGRMAVQRGEQKNAQGAECYTRPTTAILWSSGGVMSRPQDAERENG